ncbi:hypothetical protein HKX48_008663 [Thoreauomyces humboldtii]|nr:hypothetical protein HKX48_008663 [Thoreauomyces humboldtii]
MTLQAKREVSGTARLMRDIAALEREPIAGVDVKVSDKCVRNLCVILTPQHGQLRGLRLHLRVLIPDGYPMAGPEVSIQTTFPHHNIFGSWICCDILKGRIVRDIDGYIGGYTPAFSLQTIFLQLLSFFTAERVDQDYRETVKAMKVNVQDLTQQFARFSCKECNYNVQPAIARAAEPAAESSSSSTGSDAASNIGQPTTSRQRRQALRILDCVPDTWSTIAKHLTSQDLDSLSRAYPAVENAVDTEAIRLRRELRCFYLGVDFTQAVLGVGVAKSGDGRQVKMSSGFDLLSFQAFEEFNVQEGPWGETITHFLPLVINGPHFQRARPMIERQLMVLSGVNDRYAAFDPLVVIDVIGTWMNSMVVDFMKDVESANGTPTKTVLHASEKALRGYCTLLHLILTLADLYPVIAETAHARVHRFLSRDAGRSKKEVPDFGRFLVLFALVPGLDWDAVSRVLLDELLARNAYWILGKHPHLAYMEDGPSNLRLRQSFEASKTGLRLFLFQTFFIRHVVWDGAARKTTPKTETPTADETTEEETTEAFEEGWKVVTPRRTLALQRRQGIPAYDPNAVTTHLSRLLAISSRTYGFPSSTLTTLLAVQTRRFLTITTWPQVLQALAVDHLSSPSLMSAVLRDAVRSSERRGYHVTPYYDDELWTLRNAVEPSVCDLAGKPRRNMHGVRPGRSFFPNPRTVFRRKVMVVDMEKEKRVENRGL